MSPSTSPTTTALTDHTLRSPLGLDVRDAEAFGGPAVPRATAEDTVPAGGTATGITAALVRLALAALLALWVAAGDADAATAASDVSPTVEQVSVDRGR